MSMQDGSLVARAAVATDHPHHTSRRGWLRRTSSAIPVFAYVFVVYMILKWIIPDLRIRLAPFTWTPVDLVVLVATISSMLELLRVSHAGVDNTREVFRMQVIAVVYVVCFTLSVALTLAGAGSYFGMFFASEFFMLMLMVCAQAYTALHINSRTLKRSISDDRSVLN